LIVDILKTEYKEIIVKRPNSIIFLLFILTTLTACDRSLDFSSLTTNEEISYETIHFSRQDGDCIGDPKVTKETQRCVRITIQYPEIEATPMLDMRKRLNSKIQEIILASSSDEKTPDSIDQMAYSFIQNYKKETIDHPANWHLKKVVEVLINTPQIISFSIDESGYTGGAHGFYTQNFLNLDLDIMQEIKLSDVLMPSYEAELNVTGEKIFRQTRQLALDANLEKAGYWFENGFVLNDNFAVTTKGLLFYFNAYDIAPYAMGATEVLIPYSEIQNLIDPNGTLAMFLTSAKP
jgi:hypothetical protein